MKYVNCDSYNHSDETAELAKFMYSNLRTDWAVQTGNRFIPETKKLSVDKRPVQWIKKTQNIIK